MGNSARIINQVRLALTATAIMANLLTLGAPPMVQAQDGSMLPSGQVSDPIALYKETGINDDQQQKILNLADDYEKNEDGKAHQMISFLKKLKALSYSPDLDEKAILQTQGSINKLESEMALDKMHLLINIRRVLTRNQRIRLVTLMQSKNASASGGGNAP